LSCLFSVLGDRSTWPAPKYRRFDREQAMSLNARIASRTMNALALRRAAGLVVAFWRSRRTLIACGYVGGVACTRGRPTYKMANVEVFLRCVGEWDFTDGRRFTCEEFLGEFSALLDVKFDIYAFAKSDAVEQCQNHARFVANSLLFDKDVWRAFVDPALDEGERKARQANVVFDRSSFDTVVADFLFCFVAKYVIITYRKRACVLWPAKSTARGAGIRKSQVSSLVASRR
jgi:hypothetical protein